MRAAEAGSYLDRSSGSSVITGPQRWERKAGGSVRGDVTTQQCLGDSAGFGDGGRAHGPWMAGASRDWDRQQNRFFLEPPEGVSPAHILPLVQRVLDQAFNLHVQ